VIATTFYFSCQMIRSFIHHHIYNDRVFLKGRTQILFFKKKKKTRNVLFPSPEMVLRDRTGSARLFYFFGWCNTRRETLPCWRHSAAQCTDVKYILDKETLRERYTQRTGGWLCGSRAVKTNPHQSMCTHTSRFFLVTPDESLIRALYSSFFFFFFSISLNWITL
jgi:hypothetical protein